VPLYAFYDCQPPNRRKDAGGSIVGVDGDVAMLVNVRFSPAIQLRSKTRWVVWQCAACASALARVLQVVWGISKSDVPS